MDAIYWPSFFFLLFGAIACGFAVAVVFATSIVRMAFFLVLCLSATSGLMFLAGADFVGAMQLMIYVGGTMVLLIFGVMLTSKGHLTDMTTNSKELAFGCTVGICMFLLLSSAALKIPAWQGISIEEAQAVTVPYTATPIAMALEGVRTDTVAQADGTPEAGKAGYLLVFIIISVHLLVVLVGASYLARPKRKRTEVAV